MTSVRVVVVVFALTASTALASGGVSHDRRIAARLVVTRAAAAGTLKAIKPPRMSRWQVGYTVGAIIAERSRELGRSLAKPRIIEITYVKPGETYLGGSHSFRWWSVRAQGTFVVCGATTCGLASHGIIAIADATRCETGGRLDGHITIIPANQVKQPHPPFNGPFCQPVYTR
jgi:hypothetical protein